MDETGLWDSEGFNSPVPGSARMKKMYRNLEIMHLISYSDMSRPWVKTFAHFPVVIFNGKTTYKATLPLTV